MPAFEGRASLPASMNAALARTASDDPAFNAESVTVAQAYGALKLPQGANRRDIKRAYRKTSLKVRPASRKAPLP